MEEKWKPIVGYEGFYEVSNLGKVRSLKRNGTNGKSLVLCKDKDGYPMCVLAVLGKNKTNKVHRLVAKAFITNPENKPCVNHINNNRSDNRVTNLEWSTIAENNSHMVNQKRHRWNKNTDPLTGRFTKKGESDDNVALPCSQDS